MNKIITIIVSILIVLALLFLAGWSITKSIERQEQRECQQWQREINIIPNWYAVEWQVEQCEHYQINLNK